MTTDPGCPISRSFFARYGTSLLYPCPRPCYRSQGNIALFLVIPTGSYPKHRGPGTTFYRTVAHSFVIPRACDFFDLFVVSAYPISCVSSPPHKAVILCHRDRIVPEHLCPGTTFHRTVALSLVIPTGAYPEHLGPGTTFYRTVALSLSSRRTRGTCGSADPSWKCFSTLMTGK